MSKIIEKWKQVVLNDLTDYRSIPFWSWNNELDEAELIRQIDEMKSVGIGGFIMHARIGLKTEYLGEKWFSCIKACLDHAKKLKMNAWIYDENGWPSGFVGGKLLENEDFRARFLEYEIKDSFDDNAFGVYKETDCGFVRIEEAEEGVSSYHTVYLRISPANTDILNPAVVDAFISETHEKYYERFADSFGKELVGFFTDEPQYYRWGTPYTPMLEAEFKKDGKDVRDGLVYLFLKDERGYPFREKYFRTLNELYTVNFYKRLYDWCEAHNCKLTGHSVDEMRLFSQMWGGAACMPTYEYEHIPGVDFLGRNCASELAPRQLGSVASQLGFHQTLTETFACSGNDVTLKELKSIGEYQFFHGVTLMCQHLYPYSLSAQGKSDHPPVFSSHNNWGEGFGVFNEHFTRLGYLISNTKESYDALIIHPMRSVYLDYIRSLDDESVAELENDFKELLSRYRRVGIRYHFADERILERHGKVKGDKIIIGNCSYDTVIVPKMKNISRPTLDLLKDYTGKLLCYGTPEYVNGEKESVPMRSTVTEKELFENRGVKFNSISGNCGIATREGELGSYLFIKNYSRTEPATFTVSGLSKDYQALDLVDLTLSPVTDTVTLGSSESLILVNEPSDKKAPEGETEADVTESFKVTDISDNYLVLDYASYSTDGVTFTEYLPMPELFEKLLRADYKGDVFIKQRFSVTEKMPLTLIMEKSRYRFVRLNGKELEFKSSDYDIFFTEAELKEALNAGENELFYAVDYYQHEGVHFALFDPLATESLRNCLYYDTHIEPVYLKGRFSVDKNHLLSPLSALPPITDRMCDHGFPFFKGYVDIEGKTDYDGIGRRVLSLDGRFLVSEVTVNGKRADLYLDVKRDITDLLAVGENSIKIRVRSSLRNLFGPLHFAPNPEPMAVGPYNFNMRGSWKNGKSKDYTHEYQTVPFGVSKIKIITKI